MDYSNRSERRGPISSINLSPICDRSFREDVWQTGRSILVTCTRPATRAVADFHNHKLFYRCEKCLVNYQGPFDIISLEEAAIFEIMES
jgi:hypothetical protein